MHALQEEVEAARAEIASLRSQLSTQKETNSLLEHQVQLLQQELSDVFKEKEECVRAMNQDLDDKSASIAYLVTKLHSCKSLLCKKINEERQKQQSSEKLSPCMSPETPPLLSQLPLKPSPPTEPRPESAHKKGRITRRLRRTCSTPPVSANRHLPSIPNSPVSGSSTPDPPSHSFYGTNTVSLSSMESRKPHFKPPSYHPLNAPVTPSTWAKHHHHHPKAASDLPVIEKSQRRISIDRVPQLAQAPSWQPQPRRQPNVVLPPIRPGTPYPRSELHYDHSFATRHHHLILAKSQGLASAPSSTSLKRHSYRQAMLRGKEEMDGEDEEEEEEEEEEEVDQGEGVEGTLMVPQGLEAPRSWRQLHQSHAK